MDFHRSFKSTKGWLVFILCDFFQNHLPFRRKFFFVEGWAEHVRQQINEAILELGEDCCVINGLFFTGVGIALSTQFVQFPIDIGCRATARSLEHHVFQEMTQSRFAINFIAGPGADKVPKRG